MRQIPVLRKLHPVLALTLFGSPRDFPYNCRGAPRGYPQIVVMNELECLLDDKAITKAKITQGAIVLENGLDLAPDTLYKEIKLNPDKYYKIT